MADFPPWCSIGPLSYVLPGCDQDVPWQCRWLGLTGRVYCKRKGEIKGDDPLTTIADNAAKIGENAINLATHIDVIVYGALVIGGAIVVSTLIRDLRGL